MSDIIATRRHQKLKEKENVYKLIYDSYRGGETYLKGGHLWQHPKEFEPEYKKRKKRTVFLNHVQPLSDMIAGFIYTQGVTRDNIPDKIKSIIDKASKGKSLDSFMMSLAIQSLQYPMGVLIDSPSYDVDEIKTEADRVKAGLTPYCVTYTPDKIRDFNQDESGDIEWALLDNSYIDKSDATKEPIPRKVYRLWDKEKWCDYEIIEGDIMGDVEVVKGEEQFHNLGQCPFIICNWRDVDNDLIAETPFEDIAILDRAIYNHFSLLEEMLSSGTFKQLFYPVSSKDDLPKAIIAGGASSLSIIPYNGKSSAVPFYEGAGLTDIQPFIQAIELYLKEIFSKLGLDNEREKGYHQSGVAKNREFEKAESLLRQGARSLEECEKKIFEIFGLWLGTSTDEVIIDYPTQFQKEDIDNQTRRMYELFQIPYSSISDYALERIVKLLAFDEDKDELLNKLKAEMSTKSATVTTDKDIEDEL